MAGRFADLHIHSFYSDGTMSPAEIVEYAKEHNAGLISICDHNVLEGSRLLKELCENEGIGYIPSAEIDTLDNGIDYHLLAYGADLYLPDFVQFVKRNRQLLDDISTKLVCKMSGDVAEISLPDYEGFSYDRALGGWKCLHYLVHKGLAETLKDALKYYIQYNCPFSIVDFPSIPEAADMIHKAGGYAVLAHPGVSIPCSNIELFSAELQRLLGLGIDGVECYYPSHSQEITAEALSICYNSGLIITAGSDCHGGFGKTRISEMNITIDRLNLKDLV